MKYSVQYHVFSATFYCMLYHRKSITFGTVQQVQVAQDQQHLVSLGSTGSVATSRSRQQRVSSTQQFQVAQGQQNLVGPGSTGSAAPSRPRQHRVSSTQQVQVALGCKHLVGPGSIGLVAPRRCRQHRVISTQQVQVVHGQQHQFQGQQHPLGQHLVGSSTQQVVAPSRQ